MQVDITGSKEGKLFVPWDLIIVGPPSPIKMREVSARSRNRDPEPSQERNPIRKNPQENHGN